MPFDSFFHYFEEDEMNRDDVVVGNKRKHPGECYGGAAQRGEHDLPGSSLSAREVRFMSERPYHRQNPEAMHARTEARKKVASVKAINEKKIKWEAVNGTPPHRIVNCLFLKAVVERLKLDHPSLNNPLYEDMLERLRTPKFAVVTRFYIVESGEDPERREELGTFIKMKALEEKFILPLSFLWDCAQTFLAPPRR